jgi:hypothetical protein
MRTSATLSLYGVCGQTRIFANRSADRAAVARGPVVAAAPVVPAARCVSQQL